MFQHLHQLTSVMWILAAGRCLERFQWGNQSETVKVTGTKTGFWKWIDILI